MPPHQACPFHDAHEPETILLVGRDRIETYAISLARGSGQVVINGAAARHFHPGDKVIIVAFCLTDEQIEPRMIAVDDQNRFVQNLVPNGAPDDAASRRDPVEA